MKPNPALLAGASMALICALMASNGAAAQAAFPQVKGATGAYVAPQPVAGTGLDTALGRACAVGSAATCAVPVAVSGSAGVDYSANRPALPVVGAPTFGGSSSLSSWVLLATIPAAGVRNGVRISAPGGQRLAYIEDDGTAGVGAAPNNASLDFIDPGAGVNTQGGDQNFVSHNGRFQIYGPAGAFITARSF